MEPRLLRLYNQELQHLREMGAEFAREFPKVAARLGMDGTEVADPYVERLLEGAAFLAARVQLKLDAEFPRFTQRLLEIVYPSYLAPTPSMAVVQLQPQLTEGNLARGFKVPRGAAMRSQLARGQDTTCEFRSAQEVTLWPLEVLAAEYFLHAPDLPIAQLPFARGVRGGLRVRLRVTAGLKAHELEIDRLRFFLGGTDEIGFRLYELCAGCCAGALVIPPPRPAPWWQALGAHEISAAGFADDEALLPVPASGFAGHRLLAEYFAFPQRFLFIDIGGLRPAMQRHDGDEIEIVLLFSRADDALVGRVEAANVVLHCTPAINLFPKRLDRIHLTDGVHEYHAVADRARPMDYEIHDVTSVTGFGAGADSEQTFLPLYGLRRDDDPERTAYFTVRRELRLMSARQRRQGARSSYLGSEAFVAIVDPAEAPFSSDLRQLSLTAQCTNRDLPVLVAFGWGSTDFVLDAAAPLAAIRLIKGPSRPLSPLADGALTWRIISQLSLNYLALIEGRTERGDDAATVLREMLSLYARSGDASALRQIEGLRHILARPVVRRLPLAGPIAFGRGVQVEVEVDELAFEGASAYLFGAVLGRFLARHVSLNSFVELALRSPQRGEIARWRPQCGTRPTL
jgi:type VI secretion system protein ImpG